MNTEHFSAHPVVHLLSGCPRCGGHDTITIPELGVGCMTCFSACEQAVVNVLKREKTHSLAERTLQQKVLWRATCTQYRALVHEM